MSMGDVVMTICVVFCMGCFFALGRISMRFGEAYRKAWDEGWDKGWEACARTNAALVTSLYRIDRGVRAGDGLSGHSGGGGRRD